ncbi:HpcH/HpaI aldolase/citrate lyase family protein [Sphingobacterium daejeonense]|uniref:HpcH/HpaI aldolase/citrate lyase family protein n=1 Tax=Sphingobacterium daejeonense TaxID=371142 RepID=A0ABW3RK26_9SPHI|nr:aldolase/citrate lyase family protein [Sphingobacterium daejeonense]MCT1530137.1 aldolase/citrate lyase family protein [Sphingobacterium daejeonense]
MRRSKVLQKLRNGEKPSCFKVNIKDAQVSELAALCGFDCIWVDQEHIGQDWSTLASHVWATKAHDVDLMVRVARGSYSDYIRALELDATGLLVPHIMSLQDAKDVVYMTRFHPLGRRPIDGGNADGAYTMKNFNEYLQDANKERFIVLQIEDPEPLSELEEIAQLDGYDMLFFGPGDFSQGIGSPGDWNNPKLIETRRKIAEVANKHGKYAATVGSTENLQELLEMGYHFISVGADVVGIKNYCLEITQAFGNSESKDSGKSYLEKN